MHVGQMRAMAQVFSVMAVNPGMKDSSPFSTLGARGTRTTVLERPIPREEPRTLELEFHTDLICPWCYVFKRRLDQVLGSLYAPVQVLWTWQPLFPDLPPAGAPFSDWIRRHFKEYDNPQQVFNQLQLSALREDLSLNLLTLGHLPHPGAAWRLMLVAQEQGLQHALGEMIYQALFQENMDISRWEVLRSLALCLGMDDESIRMAKEDARIARILESQRQSWVPNDEARTLPRLRINRQWEVRGMVSRDALFRQFDQALFPAGTETGLPC